MLSNDTEPTTIQKHSTRTREKFNMADTSSVNFCRDINNSQMVHCACLAKINICSGVLLMWFLFWWFFNENVMLSTLVRKKIINIFITFILYTKMSNITFITMQ